MARNIKNVKKVTLSEYNATADYPVLTWAAESEFNVFVWLEKNHNKKTWHNELSVDILDNNQNGTTADELFVEVDEFGDATNTTDVFISSERGEGINFYYKDKFINIHPLDFCLVEDFLTNQIKGIEPYNFLIPQEVYFPYEKETTPKQSCLPTDADGYIWGMCEFSKVFDSVQCNGVEICNGALQDAQ